MLVAFLVTALTLLVFFRFLSYTKAKVNAIQNEIFHSTQIKLRKAQREISATNLSPIDAKKAFDKQARQIMYHSAQLAYGDEATIPMEHYAEFREEAKFLKKKFNKGIRSYKAK